MTDAMMNLRTFVEKIPDTDLLREMIGFAAEKLETRKNPRGIDGFVIHLPCRDLEAGQWTNGLSSGSRSISDC